MAVAVRQIPLDLALPAPAVLRTRAIVGVLALWSGLVLATAAEVVCVAVVGGALWTLAVGTVAAASATTSVLASRLHGAIRGSISRVSVWPRRSLAAGLGLAVLAAVAVWTGVPTRSDVAALGAAILVGAGCVVALRLVRPILRVLVIGDAFFHDRMSIAAGRTGRFIVAHADPSVLQPGASHNWISNTFDEIAVQPNAFKYVWEIAPDIRARCRRTIIPAPPSEADGAYARRAWIEPFVSPLPLGARCLKRALDLVIAPLALLALSPLLLLAAIAIVVDSPGAAFFHQQRIGVDGRPFMLLKLRTMARRNNDAEHQRYMESLIRGEGTRHGGMHKLVSDQRVTRVGRVVRRFSLDEIPQLLNVIKGDMSLIGPRPPLAREVELYDLDAWQRLRVKPGLSGLWQVNGRCELDFREMVGLDVRYWQSWTPSMELGILVRTPWTVVSGRGAA